MNRRNRSTAWLLTGLLACCGVVIALSVVLLRPSPAAASCSGSSDPSCPGGSISASATYGSGANDPTGGRGQHGGGTTGGGGYDPCAQYSGYAATLCYSGFPGQTEWELCMATVYPVPPRNPALTPAQLNQLLTFEGCPVYSATPPLPTAQQLAESTHISKLLPPPSGHRSPAETQLRNGFPYTFVNYWTFFWTDPDTWLPRSVTATAGPNTATVTATPISLSFGPGDGGSPVICAGPGRPRTAADGDGTSGPVPGDGACAYQYLVASGPSYDDPFQSVQSITWKVTWTGSNNKVATGGTFANLVTATTGPLNVLQVQSLVVN